MRCQRPIGAQSITISDLRYIISMTKSELIAKLAEHYRQLVAKDRKCSAPSARFVTARIRLF
jgi:hypothetical protein